MKPQDACPLQARQTRTSARPPGAGGVLIIGAARASRNPHDLTIILPIAEKTITTHYRPELVNGAFAYRMPRRYGTAKVTG